MEIPKAADVKKGISVLWDTLQCPICLDLMAAPVSTKCDHQFCKFCMMKLLNNTKQNKANCPVCKSKITKRSLQESPGFQRLVAGLQEMILAYENDTGLNYFTGMSRQNQRPEGTYTKGADCHNEVSVGDAPCSEPDNEEDVQNGLPLSHSSTVAAKNGFAILMGLEDTGPLTADNDGLDSGLGEAPPTSDKQMFSPADVMEREPPEVQRTPSARKTRVKKKVSNMKETPIQPSLIQDAPEHLGRCSKKKPKRQLESDKLLDQKQKKSLEKVAEWLMKVPTQGSLELEKPNEDEDDSDGCSSTSTIDVPQINYVSATRGDRAKALEEQVFGAIYRRERKGNRTVCLPCNVVGKATKPTETATETVCSAEFYKDASTRDMKEEHSMIEEKDTNSDILKEQTEILEGNSKEGFVEELTNVPESDKDEVVCPMSDIEQQQPETEPKTMRTRTMQKVDNDLFNQSKEKSENTEQNKKQTKSNKRRSKNIKPEKANPARVTNPLVLVTVENGETSPKIRPEEVQVHIENYPSSEDQEVPVARSTRRSSRLQVFTREVQEGHKKVNMRAKVPKKERNVANRSANPENVVLKNVLLSNSRRSKRNGCIYNQDIGEIENMESAERTSCAIPDKDSETLSEARAGCYAPVVPSSKSPTEAAVNPTNHFPISTWVEKKFTAIENENEEDRNDSEIDTEQLVRSFKTSKRKSFHLGGGADVKRSRCSDQESVEAEENQHVHFGSEPAQICPEITNKQVLSSSENLSCSDLISQSNSPGLIRKTVVEKPDQVVEEASIPDGSCSDSDSAVDNPVIGNSVSSQLPPNQVSKCNVESPCLSLMPKVGDSGLCFTTIIPSQTPQNQPDCTMREDTQDRETAGQVLNTESSLTPDGLVKPVAQFAQETKAYSQGSGELSTHSSVKITTRKRTRVQRLESSSDSSYCTEEELPALAKIFGTSAPPATVTRDQEDHAEAGTCEGVPAVRREQLNHPPACLSPDCVDSSQVSVDLFGTPDECEATVNDPGVSMDSSQFSSEVLVTQQKIEMQKELVRLEKLMALVSEVLQEKEASPAKDVPSKTNQNGKITGADIHKPLPHDQNEVSELKTLPEAEQEPNMRCSDANGVAHPAGSKTSTVAEIAARHSINTDSRTSRKLGSSSAARTINSNGSPSEGQEDKENSTPEKGRSKAKMVLVSSGLGPSEQVTVKKFARQIDARVVSQVTSEVTHVIMHTDEQLVCERTLKYFLGIAGRKWVVSFQWISECFKQKKLLNESSFEVRGDVVNGSNHQGPMKARTTEDANLLMKDYKICFHGPFTDMTTDNLEWMVELCGATVVQDPLLLDAKQKDHQLVVVPSGSEPASTYSSLSRQATVVTRGWLLDTVATYTIQNHRKYTAELRAP